MPQEAADRADTKADQCTPTRTVEALIKNAHAVACPGIWRQLRNAYLFASMPADDSSKNGGNGTEGDTNLSPHERIVSGSTPMLRQKAR